MNETPFEKFIALIQVDQTINTLHQSIQSLEHQNNENKILDESHKVLFEKSKAKLYEIRKEVDSKELEMKILDQEEAEKKKKLDHVANHKEYQLIKSEIDTLKKAQHDLEDSLVEAWNQLENAKKEMEESVQKYEVQHTQVQQHLTSNNEKISEINRQIEMLMQERNEKETKIPAEWIEKYATMRARVTDPVVPVINGNCTACFYKVSAQDMQFLKQRKLIQCKDCFRLLYLPEVQQSAIQT